MALRLLFLLPVAVLLLTAFSGCVSINPFGGTKGIEKVEAPDWRVGDTWVYASTGSSGEELVYERKVNAVFLHGANLVYELKSGLRNHPLQDYHLYRTDDLRFVGSDAREGSQLMKRVAAQEPIVFHYVFPLVPGEEVEQGGVLKQRVASHHQEDPVRVEASAGKPRSLVLGERVYEVVPYEIRIRYEATPFDDEVVIRGHWAPAVGQSVLTVLEEGGRTTRHELLYFERTEPGRGAPAYSLVEPLSSHRLERGFEARLSQEGWQRYLFHVEDPARIGVSVNLPRDGPGAQDRLDVVSLRPLGYSRAGIAEELTDLATGGLFLHVSATDGEGDRVHHHAAQGVGNDLVYLRPGQVYELVVASDRGDVSVRVEHGEEAQSFPAVAQGDVEVLSSRHEHVQGPTDPGPQRVRQALDVAIDNPDGERVEGVVYVMNHGGGDQAVAEVEGRREVHLSVDNWAWTDDQELFAYYFGYVPRDGFRLRTGYEYSATLAVQGAVDYEMGVLLLKLLPP